MEGAVEGFIKIIQYNTAADSADLYSVVRDSAM
jgi:hypothetical protein